MSGNINSLLQNGLTMTFKKKQKHNEFRPTVPRKKHASILKPSTYGCYFILLYLLKTSAGGKSGRTHSGPGRDPAGKNSQRWHEDKAPGCAGMTLTGQHTPEPNSPWKHYGSHNDRPSAYYLHAFQHIARARALDVHTERHRRHTQMW